MTQAEPAADAGGADPPGAAPAPVLVIDGDCGFCLRCGAFARRHVAAGRYAVRPWQELDLDALGLDVEAVTREAWFVDADGARHGGHLAIAAALRRGRPLTRPLGALLASRALAGPAAWVYRWVADNRHRLPSGGCRLAGDGGGAPRS